VFFLQLVEQRVDSGRFGLEGESVAHGMTLELIHFAPWRQGVFFIDIGQISILTVTH
jgi:hypothetical protein